MRQLVLSIVLAAVCGPAFATTNSIAVAATERGPTYVIPIKGMIERGLLYAMRRGLDDARASGADAVVLHMDTPGGSVGVTEEIIRLMIGLPDTITTYTFIDSDALSAGALISLSTQHIYMSPGSRIGASAIVTPFGDIKDGDMKEKHVSSLIALVSSAAQRNGHDPTLVEAMVRRDASYEVDGETLCEEGQLLTLTDLQATRVVGTGDGEEPLLASGIADSLEDLLGKIGRRGLPVHNLDVTWSEKVARWIEMFSIVFLIGGGLGLYIEFKIPGFGLPGMIGLGCLAIFFWGHHVAGLAGTEEILVFLLGAVLLAVELFVIPGFGITGILGITLIFTSLLMAMVQHDPGGPFLPPPAHLYQAAANLSISVIVVFIAMLILGRLLPRTSVFRQLALSTSIDRGRGFQASPETASLVGSVGVAETDLHPAGIGTFGDDRLNVVSRGSYLKKGCPIIVAETHGNRIVVECHAAAYAEGPDEGEKV